MAGPARSEAAVRCGRVCPGSDASAVTRDRRRQWAPWVFAGAVAAWRTGAALPASEPRSAAAADPTERRDEARRLYQEGLRWSQREGGVPAWLGQRELFAKAVAADPGFGPAWSHLAFTYSNVVTVGFSVNPAEDLRAAEAAAERGLALAPDNSDAYAALGSVLRLRPERLEDAIVAYRKALELSPASHPSRANIGWLLALVGRPEEGEVLIRTSLASSPPEHPLRAVWHYQLGLIELLLGRDGFGVENLRRGLRGGGSPGKGSVVALVSALALTGQRDEAAQLLAEALQRWPGLSSAALRADPLWPTRQGVLLEGRERILEALSLAGLP